MTKQERDTWLRDIWLVPKRLYNLENPSVFSDSRLELEAAGFEVFRAIYTPTDVFYAVEPPKGWMREPDDDRVSAKIYDETGAMKVDCYFTGKLRPRVIFINSFLQMINN